MVNPFEPPRSADMSAAGAGDSVGTLPEAALGELVASAPWARWASRLALVGLVASLINAAVTLTKAKTSMETISAVVGLAFGIPLALVFSVLFRRYAQHAARLPERTAGTLTSQVEAQRALFKGFGIVTIITMVMVPVITIGAVIMAVAASRGAR